MKEAGGNNNPEIRKPVLDAREYNSKTRGTDPLHLPPGTRVDIQVSNGGREDRAVYVRDVEIGEGVEVYLSGNTRVQDAELPHKAHFVLTSPEKRETHAEYFAALDRNDALERREEEAMRKDFQDEMDRELGEELGITLQREPDFERDFVEALSKVLGEIGGVTAMPPVKYYPEDLSEFKEREAQIDRELALRFIDSAGLKDQVTVDSDKINHIRLSADLWIPKDTEE